MVYSGCFINSVILLNCCQNYISDNKYLNYFYFIEKRTHIHFSQNFKFGKCNLHYVKNEIIIKTYIFEKTLSKEQYTEILKLDLEHNSPQTVILITAKGINYFNSSLTNCIFSV